VTARVKLGVVGVVVFITAYVASIVLFISDGMGHPHQVTETPASSGGTTVTADVEDIRSDNSLLVANYTVSPGPELLDPVTHILKEDLSFMVTSAVTASRRTWPKGTLPDVFQVSLPLTGDVADWPFDRYQSGPITAHLVSGGGQNTVVHAVRLVDRLLGWKINVARVNETDALGAYRVDLHRSSTTVAFGVVILGVLVALAGASRLASIRKLDRRHDRSLGDRRVGDLDADLHLLLVAASEARRRNANCAELDRVALEGALKHRGIGSAASNVWPRPGTR